jgi:hypothetical protein
MRFIKDGNYISWVRTSIWVAGITIAILSYFFMTGAFIYRGMVTGIIIAAIGAYAESANTLRLRPFDNSYKETKKSYKKGK